MATLLFELVRVLSVSAGRELRERADGPALSRAESMALATLSDLSAACLAAGAAPDVPADCRDWTILQTLAGHDAQVIATAKSFAAAGKT